MTGKTTDRAHRAKDAADVLVTVRLPASLVEELKLLVQKHHYMDTSEAIRGVLRRKWEQSSDPLAHEVRQLRASIEGELKRGIARKSEQRLVDELEKVREKIREELE